MNQILPYPLWIGSTGDLQDWRRLYDLGIRAIVQLAYEEMPVLLPRDFIGCRFPLVDGPENERELLQLAIATLTQLLERKFPTLVCCQAGRSRSPGIAAAALAKLTNASFSDALQQLAILQPCDLHPALYTQIQALCMKP